MTQYLKKSFTVPVGGNAYASGWDRIFTKTEPEDRNTEHRRLLDMLAGWQSYVATCADHPIPGNKVSTLTYESELDTVFDLYQLAGSKEEMNGDAVREFVLTRVIPFLLRGG